MAQFALAVGWLTVLLFVLPALGYLALIALSRVRVTMEFVTWYAIFLGACFIAAVPVVALTWPLPPIARAGIAAIIVYAIAMFVPFASVMARYPLYVVRCGGPPLVGTVFAAAYTYEVPGSPAYAVTPLDTHFFCTENEAIAAGFHERREETGLSWLTPVVWMARARRGVAHSHDDRSEGPVSPSPVTGAAAPQRPNVRIKARRELVRQRRRKSHSCWKHLTVAPLWPLHGANLGTLLRTCDATGACMAVPRFSWVPQALEKGNTLRRPACVHWVQDPVGWLTSKREAGTRVLGVELAEGATRLADLPPARIPTIALLGHEQYGIPDEALDLLDETVEIPMIGTGCSLNVAVAGSLVLYRLAGLS